jgi:ketosteroid isomerase-like protein
MRIAMLVLTVALASCASRPVTPVADKSALPNADPAMLPAELASVHPGLYRAWQGDDPTAMRPYYADHAVIVTPTDRFTGWNDMQTRWLTPTLKSMSGFMAMPSSFTREGADIIERGRYSFSTTQKGTLQDVHGNYAQRWQLSPSGLWRVVSVNIVADD